MSSSPCAAALRGAVGNTRQEKSNVIPGVAIATALMPPLCTAGYGLASGHYPFFLGAMYLFFINAFFIALAAFLVFKLLGVPSHGDVRPHNSSGSASSWWLSAS